MSMETSTDTTATPVPPSTEPPPPLATGVPPTIEKRKSLPERTLSRKSSMGLDKTKGYDFSFSPSAAQGDRDEDGDEDVEAPQPPEKYESLHRYILSNGGKWSRLFHAFWLLAFALIIVGVVVATLVVPTHFVVRSFFMKCQVNVTLDSARAFCAMLIHTHVRTHMRVHMHAFLLPSARAYCTDRNPMCIMCTLSCVCRAPLQMNVLYLTHVLSPTYR